jgi:inorganic pyrophosphatase
MFTSNLHSLQVLGALRLIDSGESDSKIIVIREEEAGSIHDLASLENVKPGKKMTCEVF